MFPLCYNKSGTLNFIILLGIQNSYSVHADSSLFNKEWKNTELFFEQEE